jgi:hypothetical protein
VRAPVRAFGCAQKYAKPKTKKRKAKRKALALALALAFILYPPFIDR